MSNVQCPKSTTEQALLLVQFEFLGPKDQKLVAPSVRAGSIRLLVTGAPKVRHDLCRPFGPLERWSGGAVPALTDGATNFRSFGPKACGRLKLKQRRESLERGLWIYSSGDSTRTCMPRVEGKQLMIWARSIFRMSLPAACQSFTQKVRVSP